MLDKTITLFNRYHSRLGDVWFPHVITNVSLTNDKASIVAKYGAESSDTAKLLINYEISNGAAILGGKVYLPPKEWAAQTNNVLSQSITINDDGQNFDFFMLGEYDEDSINDDDYTNGFFDYMNNKYDYVYAITSVGVYGGLIPHFEIMAR